MPDHEDLSSIDLIDHLIRYFTGRMNKHTAVHTGHTLYISRNKDQVMANKGYGHPLVQLVQYFIQLGFNGSIQIGSNTSVNGDASTINGKIRCKSGAKIDGTLSTINGAIILTETTVKENLVTINGNITLEQGSRIKGNIVIRSRSEGSQPPKESLVIRLSGGSVVEGDIINNDDRLEVHIIIADDSKVLGEIKNAEVRRW